MDSSEEEVDIESDFNAGVTIPAPNPSSAEGVQGHAWHLKQHEAELDDLDIESRKLVIDLLDEDRKLVSEKSSKAMKATSRKVLLTDSETAIFEKGLNSLSNWTLASLRQQYTEETEIYGACWDKVATLLPFRTTEEVERFGVPYLKKRSRSDHLLKRCVNAAKRQKRDHLKHVLAKQNIISSEAPATSVSKEAPASSVSKEAPASSVSKESSATSISKESPATSVSKESSATSVSKESPATSVSKESPVHVQQPVDPTVTVNEEPQTTNLPVLSANGSSLSAEQPSPKVPASSDLTPWDGTLLAAPNHTTPCHRLLLSDREAPSEEDIHITDGDNLLSPSATITQMPQDPATLSKDPKPSLCLDSLARGESQSNCSTDGIHSDETAHSAKTTYSAKTAHYNKTTHGTEYGILNSVGEVVSMPPPDREYVFTDLEKVSLEEKRILSEFFMGRPKKTPERYLHYRNFIVKKWKSCKPEYVSKTQIRREIPDRGDVRSISRIHTYLQQIGAINFACPEATYHIAVKSQSEVQRSPTEDSNPHAKAELKQMKSKRSRRPPKKWDLLEQKPITEDITYVHGPIDDKPRTVLEPSKPESRESSKSSTTNLSLINCAEFDEHQFICPYKVVLESAAAVVMDVHSHLCTTEVIGLLGGKYESDGKVLTVVRAEPCSSTSTSLHCDMDPVSQTEAGETIEQCGLQVVGWYHSHPTFIPNPSQQDIDSQRIFQNWFSAGGNNFLGVIISPYNRSNHSVHSEIRCFTTYKDEEKGQSIPYKFDYQVQTTPDSLELTSLVPRLKKLLSMYKDYRYRVDLGDVYRVHSELTSMEKLMLSIRSHLSTADRSKVDTSLLLEDIEFIISSYS